MICCWSTCFQTICLVNIPPAAVHSPSTSSMCMCGLRFCLSVYGLERFQKTVFIKRLTRLLTIMNLLIWRWISRPQSIDMCFLLKFCKIIFCFLKIKMNVHRQKLYHKSRIFSSAMNWTCDNTTNSWREINWKVYDSFHIDFCWYS